MADNDTSQMTALDTIATENHLQMIKAAVPYVNVPEQKFISIYVKFLELTNTISFFKSEAGDMKACSLNAPDASPLDMLSDVRTYCNEEEKETVDVFINFLNSFQLYNVYKNTMEQEGDSPSNSMDVLKAFLSPEQQSMFETYNALMNT